MKPFASAVYVPSGRLEPHANHLVRRLSAMRGACLDREAFAQMLEDDDRMVYEVYENRVPEKAGQLAHGTSVVHPGKVGDEYFMTKGHFHVEPGAAEIYECLSGHGFMLMETPKGEWACEELIPGRIVYVPADWGHRSINVADEDLIQLFVFPGNAGHDYRTIEERGFRKLLMDSGAGPMLIDNPRWSEGGMNRSAVPRSLRERGGSGVMVS